MSTMEAPLRLKLRIAMDRAAAAGDWERAGQLEQQWMDVLMGRTTLDSLEARLERLDARRKEAPGQMGLDLGGGPGTGKPCGEGHIAADLTCHKGAAGAAPAPAAAAAPAPLDTKRPFSPAEMERIKAGIEQRTFSIGTVHHDGSDLALALEKLATGPNGFWAREAMAFMDEAQAIVTIAPRRDLLPKLEMGPQVNPLDLTKPIEPQIQALQAYLQEAENTAVRGLNAGKRLGVFTAERLAALEADRSPISEQRAATLRKVMGVEAPDRPGAGIPFATRRQRLDEALAAWEADPGNRQVGLQLESAYALVRNLSHTGDGPHARVMAVDEAFGDAAGMEGTGGHYSPGGNGYVVVGRAVLGSTTRGFGLKPADVDPRAMEGVISSAVQHRKIRPASHLGASSQLTDSEKTLVTHLHELGHLVHDTSARVIEKGSPTRGTEKTIRFHRQSVLQLAPDARAALQYKEGPSRYANTNEAELFAESFVAYVLAPNTLLNETPNLYQEVDRRLAKARKIARDSQDANNWYLF